MPRSKKMAKRPLSKKEMAKQGGKELPDREAMSVIQPPGGDPIQKQHEILSKYNKAAASMDVKPEDLAVVPMVYPFAK